MLKKDFEFIVVPDREYSALNAATFFDGQTILELGNTNPAEEISFIKSKLPPGKGHLWILDGYDFNSAYESDIIKDGDRLLTIDDIASRHFYAHAILNLSDVIKETDYDKEPYTKLYSGSRFALLRAPFLKAASKKERQITEITTAFVNMGGADVFNITEKVLRALIASPAIKKIHIVTGTLNANLAKLKTFVSKLGSRVQIHINLSALKMAELMAQCQLAICPASGVSFELAAVGVPMISGFTADNQRGLLETLERRGAIINIGDLKSCSVENITNAVNSLAKNIPLANTLRKNQSLVIDGNSPARIRSIIDQLINEN